MFQATKRVFEEWVRQNGKVNLPLTTKLHLEAIPQSLKDALQSCPEATEEISALADPPTAETIDQVAEALHAFINLVDRVLGIPHLREVLYYDRDPREYIDGLEERDLEITRIARQGVQDYLDNRGSVCRCGCGCKQRHHSPFSGYCPDCASGNCPDEPVYGIIPGVGSYRLH